MANTEHFRLTMVLSPTSWCMSWAATKNLWDDPASAEIKQSLLQRMLEFHIESTVHTRNARRLIVSPASAEAMQ